MPSVIRVPDVPFAGMYYPEILRELLAYLRRNREAMGLTDENEYEVHVQLLRSFALVGHLNNCRLDLTAQEMLIDSLQLLQSLKRLLKIIGVSLNSASPAAAELVAKLSEVTTVDVTGFVPELSEFCTESVPPIPYELTEEGGVPLQRTDRVGNVFGCEQVKAGACNVNMTGPDQLEIPEGGAGDLFESGDPGKHVILTQGQGLNHGEYRVTQYIDSRHVRVVRVPGGESPSFQDETDLSWRMFAFTADLATENETPGLTYQPWDSPMVGDMLYLGHPQAMPAQLDVALDTGSTDITGCWEYYDDQLSKFPPTSVVDNGDGTLTFNANSLLGTPDRHGVDITVEYVPTGAVEKKASTFASVNKIVTDGLLGQVVASTDVEDYLITATWVPLENQDDGSESLSKDGAVTFEMPQSADRNWRETEVNQVTGRWLRFRIVSTGDVPSEPTIERIAIDGGDQYIAFSVTQGETVGPRVVGSGDGTPGQQVVLPETPFLDESELIEVDETGTGGWTAWSRVENFLNSASGSRHYMLETDANDKATVLFGDGTNGRIPLLGTDNIRATYRVGGDVDGNVGSDEISANADGVNGMAEITNPRPAVGWRMKDGGTPQDIERIKRDAPAALRTRDTASTLDDIELLAVKKFVDSNGVKPVARAVAVEEGLGPKTVKLMVVGNGGVILTPDQLSELEVYFNGSRYTAPPTKGKVLTNHKVYAFNFEPKVVTISADVVWPGGNAASVRNALLALLTPLAVEDEDGVTPVWDFNGWVAMSRVHSEIHAVHPAVSQVANLKINGASASLRLGKHQLPTSSAASISINIQATAI